MMPKRARRCSFTSQLPSTGQLRTIAAWKAHYSKQGGDPRFVEMNERMYDGLRKAGMPEE